jgi:hypothetical protein
VGRSSGEGFFGEEQGDNAHRGKKADALGRDESRAYDKGLPVYLGAGAEVLGRDESRPYDRGHRPGGVPYKSRLSGVGVRAREETVLLPYDPIDGGVV